MTRVEMLGEFRAELLAMHAPPVHPNLVAPIAFALKPGIIINVIVIYKKNVNLQIFCLLLLALTLVMQLAPNGTLHSMLHARVGETDELKPIAWKQRLLWARGMARGLRQLHQCALLHRDLK